MIERELALTEPGLEARHLALAHVRRAGDLARVEPVLHFGLSGDEMLETELARDRCGEKAAGRGRHDQQMAFGAMASKQLAGRCRDRGPDLALEVGCVPCREHVRMPTHERGQIEVREFDRRRLAGAIARDQFVVCALEFGTV